MRGTVGRIVKSRLTNHWPAVEPFALEKAAEFNYSAHSCWQQVCAQSVAIFPSATLSTQMLMPLLTGHQKMPSIHFALNSPALLVVYLTYLSKPCLDHFKLVRTL